MDTPSDARVIVMLLGGISVVVTMAAVWIVLTWATPVHPTTADSMKDRVVGTVVTTIRP